MKRVLTALVATLVSVLFGAMPVYSACTQAIPTQAKAMLFGGAFTKAHTYKIALYSSASATLGATTTAYTATGEVSSSGTNYTAGGATLSGFSVTVSGTTAILDWTSDPNWTSSTITADCFMIYDSSISNTSCTGSVDPWYCCSGNGTGTCTNAALYVGTFTSTSSTNGTFTVVLPTPDASNGLIRIGD